MRTRKAGIDQARTWLVLIGLSWIVVGFAFLDEARDLIVAIWMGAFVIGGVAALLLAYRFSRRLHNWTAGLLSVPAFARALFQLVPRDETVFSSRLVAFIIWAVFALTIVLRWKDLVPSKRILDVLHSYENPDGEG